MMTCPQNTALNWIQVLFCSLNADMRATIKIALPDTMRYL